LDGELPEFELFTAQTKIFAFVVLPELAPAVGPAITDLDEDRL
jgi:hypothetical protein